MFTLSFIFVIVYGLLGVKGNLGRFFLSFVYIRIDVGLNIFQYVQSKYIKKKKKEIKAKFIK